MREYLEFVADTSSKFWEIAVSGKSTSTRWGRIGASGQTKTKKFGSGELAKSYAAAQVTAKLKKGYARKKATTKKKTASRKRTTAKRRAGKKYVYNFGGKKSDGDGSQKALLGGKGANLAEMSRIGLDFS